MSPTTKTHIHTYKRVKKGRKKTDIFACLDPDCRHYAQAHLLENKRALCPYCNMDYRLTKEMLRTLTTPHCENCTGQIRRRKPTEAVEEVKQDLNKLEAETARELIDKIEPQEAEESEGMISLEEKLARLLRRD